MKSLKRGLNLDFIVKKYATFNVGSLFLSEMNSTLRKLFNRHKKTFMNDISKSTIDRYENVSTFKLKEDMN